MFTISTAVVTAFVIVGAAQPGELEQLQGTWVVDVDESYGKPSTTKSGRLTVEVDTCTLEQITILNGSIKLDPSRTPHVFERTVTVANGATTQRGIYQLDQDIFREFSFSGGGIPTAFPSDNGPRGFLRVWRRAGAPNEGPDEQNARLDGTWKLVESSSAGRSLDDLNAGFSLIVNDSKYIMINKSTQKGAIRLDPSRTPKEVDWELTHPPIYKGFLEKGIYSVDGDNLTIIFSVPGKPRPADFVSKPVGSFKLVLRKSKPAG